MEYSRTNEPLTATEKQPSNEKLAKLNEWFKEDVVEIIGEAITTSKSSPKASILLTKLALETHLRKILHPKKNENFTALISLAWRKGYISGGSKKLCDYIRVGGNNLSHFNFVGVDLELSKDTKHVNAQEFAKKLLEMLLMIGKDIKRNKMMLEVCNPFYVEIPDRIKEEISLRDKA